MINCQLSIRYLLTDVYHAQSYDSAYLVLLITALRLLIAHYHFVKWKTEKLCEIHQGLMYRLANDIARAI